MIESIETPLPGLRLLRPRVFSDDRGYFFESFNALRYRQAGITDNFVQDNEARSAKGVLRGLHYQVGSHRQTKLLRAVCGAVFDVAVDIDPESSTYGKWFGVELSAENNLQLYIPGHFAHGYLALEDNTIVAYKCSEYYAPQSEGGIYYADETIGIEWPDLGVNFTLSEKDRQLPSFGNHRYAGSE